MSADNGVYILVTPTEWGQEYRVREMSAIDNLSWDGAGESSDPRVHLENARRMWAGCEVFTDQGKAYSYAAEVARSVPILEYGISEIPLGWPFDPTTDLEPVGQAYITVRQIEALQFAASVVEQVRTEECWRKARALQQIVSDARAEGGAHNEVRTVMNDLES